MTTLHSKTTALTMCYATLLLATGNSHADVIVALPNGSGTTTSAIGLAQYTHEFAPIADATEAYFQPTGSSSVSVEVTTTESGAIVSGWWSVFLKPWSVVRTTVEPF